MSLLGRVMIGARAGLLAGGIVGTTFFFADLARGTPLATPIALSGGILGPAAAAFDSPILLQSVAIVSFGGHLVALTLLHLLTFTGVGAVAVVAFRAVRVPLNALTAAPFGLVFFSLVFFAATWVTSAANLVELPGAGSVLLVNLLAGAVMGGYYQVASARARDTG
jgi:hypothetical protein